MPGLGTASDVNLDLEKNNNSLEKKKTTTARDRLGTGYTEPGIVARNRTDSMEFVYCVGATVWNQGIQSRPEV